MSTRSAIYSAMLRRELCERNVAYAKSRKLEHALSFGDMPVVVYKPCAQERRHGNFLDVSYEAILECAEWSRRLQKAHSQVSRALPPCEHGWKELDSSMSSDALLMNVFCYPGITENRALISMLGVEASQAPEFGFNARVPFISGNGDRTEVDMKLGDLLVESKLTESDFQLQKPTLVESYRDLENVFDRETLPRDHGMYLSYQLIRNVLAAHALKLSFCLFVDERRPDLVDAWFRIVSCVKIPELRTRCKILTWQEMSQNLPDDLQGFLEVKYGIVYPGKGPVATDDQV